MNRAIKAVIFNSQGSCLFQRAALFHSTPVLEHKKRNYWQFGKRKRRMRAKQELLRNFGAYADIMFENWRDEFHEDDPSSSRGPSWFKKQQSKGSRRDWSDNKGFYYRGRSLHLVEASSFIGPSLMMSTLNGGDPDTRITMRNLGGGALNLMRIQTQQNLVMLRVQTKIQLQIGGPLD